jgi:hypothetical protein
MERAARTFAVWATLLLVGCSNQIDATREQAVSQAASAQMTVEQWLSGTVPDHFAELALAGVSDRLGECLEKTRELAASGDDEARQFLAPLLEVDHTIDRVRNALAAGDRQEAALSLEGLRSGRKGLEQGSAQ